VIQHAAIRRPRKAPQAEALLNAACAIVSEGGLAGLTLRPLAQLLGVSVTVLSSHYGARVDVIAAICTAAAAQDEALLAYWRKMLASLGSLPPAIAAELAEAIIDELSTRHRAVSILYLELLHACTWDASLPPVFAAWSATRRGFWNGFAEAAALAPGLVACGWWHGYVVAELAYSTVLSAEPTYRMLRRLCLRRLFAGGVADTPDAGAQGRPVGGAGLGQVCGLAGAGGARLRHAVGGAGRERPDAPHRRGRPGHSAHHAQQPLSNAARPGDRRPGIHHRAHPVGDGRRQHGRAGTPAHRRRW
jgi:AcrR family transcriptional regulator